LPHGDQWHSKFSFLDGLAAVALGARSAVLQLLLTETAAAQWLFPQEKATLHDAGHGTEIGEPL
jgi:hypothetical protein